MGDVAVNLRLLLAVDLVSVAVEAGSIPGVLCRQLRGTRECWAALVRPSVKLLAVSNEVMRFSKPCRPAQRCSS